MEFCQEAEKQCVKPIVPTVARFLFQHVTYLFRFSFGDVPATC